MSSDVSFSTPAEHPVDRPHRLPRWARLRPAAGGLLLALVGAAAAGAIAWGLAALFSPLGVVSAPVAAAIGMLMLLLPLLAVLLKLARQLDRAQELMARLDTMDTLTGVANRAHFVALAEREWARARRYGTGAGIVIIDVDRFRRLCEARGSSAGDAVLRELAASVGRSLRGADALARYGPSSLVAFLAQADPTGALDVAERIRERAEQLEVAWQEQRMRITVSAGVATLRPAHVSVQSFLQDAEIAAEAARAAGGNCVRAAPVDAQRHATHGPSVGDNQAAGPL